jgi:hypothetical protein
MTQWPMRMTSYSEFEGSGVDFGGSQWSLTGAVRMGKQAGQANIKFTQHYIDGDDAKYVFDGTLCLDKKIMRGKFQLEDNSDINGEFFLQLAPNPLTLCYRPLELDLTAKQRWFMASNTVLEIKTRESLQATFVSRRVQLVKRLIELGYKEDRHDFTEDEAIELWAIKKVFLPSEIVDVYASVDWYKRVSNQVG